MAGKQADLPVIIVLRHAKQCCMHRLGLGLTGYHSGGLQGLPGAHVIGQDAMQPTPVEESQPVDAFLLVGPKFSTNEDRQLVRLCLQVTETATGGESASGATFAPWMGAQKQSLLMLDLMGICSDSKAPRCMIATAAIRLST